MSKPVIILGAGASYDYPIYSGIRPPLTNDLVKEEFLDMEALSHFKEAASLLTGMSYTILKGIKSFEEILMDIKKETGNLPHRKSQFVSLEFYLQRVFHSISIKAQHPLNNYKTLIQKIKDYNEGRAHIVSFNYDTLFESSVGIDFWQTMESYIKNDIKLIKVHGSHDWIYIDHKDSVMSGYLSNDNDDYDFCMKNPDYLDNLRSLRKDISPYTIAHIEKRKDRGRGFIKFPAIAIPLPDKSAFICPQAHLRELELALNMADRVLIIGWKVGDKYFLDLMKEHLPDKVPITVVSSSKESAEEIILSRLSDFSCKAASGDGFSDFVDSDEIKRFFV